MTRAVLTMGLVVVLVIWLPQIMEHVIRLAALAVP